MLDFGGKEIRGGKMEETIKSLLSEFFVKYNYQERLKTEARFEMNSKRFEEAKKEQKELIKKLEKDLIQIIKGIKHEEIIMEDTEIQIDPEKMGYIEKGVPIPLWGQILVSILSIFTIISLIFSFFEKL